MEVGNTGIWDWNLKTDVVRFDDRFNAILGYAPGELPSTLDEWLPYHHPEDVPIWMSKANAYLKGESPIYESEHRIRNKSGAWDWIFTRGKLVQPPTSGPPEHFLGIAMAITDRKEAEEALKESEERLHKTFRLSPIAIAIQRLADRRFVDVNDSFLNMFGYSRDEVLGRTSAELNMYEDPDERGAMVPLFEKGKIENREMTLRTKTGTLINLLFSTEKIVLDGRDHLLSVLSDITERKKAEEELKRLNRTLQAIGDSSQAMLRARTEKEYLEEVCPDRRGRLRLRHGLDRLRRR